MTGTWLDRLADEIDPPPPEGDHLGPLDFGIRTGRGRYHHARHLAVMEQECLQALTNAGRLLLEVAIRHGKTQFLVRLIAWWLLNNPDKRVIWAAHTDDFAARRGRQIRDLVHEWGPPLYGGIRVSRRSESASRWDIEGHAGGMITVGRGGTPVGEGADTLVIDDPLKSFDDAMSPVTRGKTNEWITGTLFGRLEPQAAVIMALARWHEDDPGGVVMREDPDHWQSLRLPGLCDDPATDPLGRELGQAMWPEGGWTEEEHQRRRHEMTMVVGEFIWLAQVQQAATRQGGGKFPEDRWQWIPSAAVEVETRWVRGWDLAATEGGGDWTVGVLVGQRPNGRFVIGDVIRGQWSGHEWRTRMRTAALTDPRGTRVRIPQDPGQAGKDQAAQLVTFMAGFDVEANPVTGSKEIRAASYAAQQQARNIDVVEADWNGAFVAEHVAFPRAAHDDQVDAAATGFNALALEGGVPRYRGSL